MLKDSGRSYVSRSVKNDGLEMITMLIKPSPTIFSLKPVNNFVFLKNSGFHNGQYSPCISTIITHLNYLTTFEIFFENSRSTNVSPFMTKNLSSSVPDFLIADNKLHQCPRVFLPLYMIF